MNSFAEREEFMLLLQLCMSEVKKKMSYVIY